MQIYANKLAAHLKSNVANVYLIAGDDNLLRDDAAKLVRQAAAKQGFSDSQTFVQDKTFSWSQLLEASSALSLFAEKRLIELKLSSSKIGTEGSQAVMDCLGTLYASAEPDTLLLINAPRIEGKPKWVNEISDKGIYVPIYPLEPHELPGWLIQRAKASNLKLARDAAELLAERVEGNLVSGVQELEKLALLIDKDETVSIEVIDSSVSDNARFTAFNMLDRAIEGDSRAACKALQKIRDEGNEAIAIVGAIAYQVRNLITLRHYARDNQLSRGFKAQRILAKRQNAVSNALKRLTIADLEFCITLLSKADGLCKSGQSQIGWLTLETVILKLSGKPLPIEGQLASYQTH